MSRRPLACSLSARELAEREAHLGELLSGPLRASRRDGRALVIEVDHSPGLRERIEHAVELERACCPFLDFCLERAGDRPVLRIDGAPDAAPVIDGFVALVS